MRKDAFKYIFDTYFDCIRNYIYYRSGDKELATDVAQETFMIVWEKIDGLSEEGIKSLLYKISGDLLITQLRKQKVAVSYKVKNVNYDSVENPHEQLKYKELLANYENALKTLPVKQRTVFLLSRMDGLKYHEIASHIGISVKAVEKRMKNALEYLRKAIEN